MKRSSCSRRLLNVPANRNFATRSKSQPKFKPNIAPTAPPSASFLPGSSIRGTISLIPGPKALACSSITRFQKSLGALLNETRITWTHAENIQLPLRSYADIPKNSIVKLEKVLQEHGKSVAPVAISLRGIGVTPSWRKPRVLWICVDKGKNALKSLATSIEEKVTQGGIIRKRVNQPFLAYLPIGTWSDVYVKELNSTSYRDSCLLHGNRFTAEWEAKEMVLLSSNLSRDGEKMETIFSVPFLRKTATIKEKGSS